MPVIIIISSLALAIGLAIVYWLHSQYTLDVIVFPATYPASLPAPRVSVIVPARNEQRNIQRCVTSLLGQTYPDFEIIVIDDRSVDRTPQILERLAKDNPGRLRILRGEELPPDWAGKPHALSQGARAAEGEWLCFVDADTFARPEMLSSALLAAQRTQADLFTMMTGQELGGFWEKVILPVVFTALSVGFPARRVNDPRLPDAIANGQFILIKSQVYEATGGHAAVKERIDEDKALAETVKHAGYRLVLADGRSLAVTHMYTSLPEIWEGWTKNIFVGMRDKLGLLLFGALLSLVAALALPAWLLAGLLWLAGSGGLPAFVVAVEALILWGYLLYQRALAARAFHISAWYALTLPLGALLFAALMAASAYKVLSGQGVTWRGRRYRP